MGEQQVRSTSDGAHHRAFTKHVLNDLRAMEHMIDRGMFESDIRRIGAEQEMVLIDERRQPASVSLQVLELLADPQFTTELAQFNMECNLDPVTFGGDCLRLMEQQLTERMLRARQAAHRVGADVILTGIVPTLAQTHLSLDHMTPKPRYFALNEGLSRLRGEAYEFRLTGTDELNVRQDSVMLEACNTSFQVHFQVSPEEFARRYNIAQAVAAPVLAVAANSPLLFGRRLWRETRIGLFQQAVDTRKTPTHADERVGRVSFGRRWVESSVLEIFQEDITRFRVLIASDLEEDPFDALAEGRVPRLGALCMHNSTVYRWNRPCYGILEGKPHLRIENRVLPAGPTIIDSIANAAFWFGLMSGMARRYEDITQVMEFDDAKANFLAAARHGLAAQFEWIGGDRPVPVQELIADELLPLARKGLTEAGIRTQDIDRYLGVIEGRVESGHTGARWLLHSLARMKDHGTLGERLTSLTDAALRNQWRGEPVHTWSLAELDRVDTVKRNYQRIEQYMTTDVLAVNADDSIDLVANIMVWRGLRHVPVENRQHELVGLVSYRQLLRILAEQPLNDRRENIPVSEIMEKDVLTVAPESRTLDAIRFMRDHKLSCLPVVKNGNLVGIVTDYDFLIIAADMIERELTEGPS